MPKPGRLQRLPKSIRESLNQRIIANGFGGYTQLAEWLEQQGYTISRASVASYGKDFKKRFNQLEAITAQARAIAEAAGDDENMLGDALGRLAQLKAFDAVINLESEDLQSDPHRLLSIVATLNRSSVAVKKYQAEVRERIEQAAEEIEVITKERGLSDETAAQIRRKILGIAP